MEITTGGVAGSTPPKTRRSSRTQHLDSLGAAPTHTPPQTRRSSRTQLLHSPDSAPAGPALRKVRRDSRNRPILSVQIGSNDSASGSGASTPVHTLNSGADGGADGAVSLHTLTDTEIAAIADGAIARAYAHTVGGPPPLTTPIRAPRVPHAPRSSRGRRSSLQAFVDAEDEGAGAAGVLSAMSRSVQAQVAQAGGSAKRRTRRQSLVYEDGEQFLNSTTRGQEKFFEGAVQAEDGGAADGDAEDGATPGKFFYLFTVTFCANSAHDLTCPPHIL